MNDQLIQPEDDFGPDPIDRGSFKGMGPSEGGGGWIDPSYEDALRILGRGDLIPSPFEQRALVMDDAEAAGLARRLTELRAASGAGTPFLGFPSPAGQETMTEITEQWIAALQEVPPHPEKLARLRAALEGADEQVRLSLATLCEHPGVQAKLAAGDPEP